MYYSRSYILNGNFVVYIYNEKVRNDFTSFTFLNGKLTKVVNEGIATKLFGKKYRNIPAKDLKKLLLTFNGIRRY
jgi:hypothetical protein